MYIRVKIKFWLFVGNYQKAFDYFWVLASVLIQLNVIRLFVATVFTFWKDVFREFRECKIVSKIKSFRGPFVGHPCYLKFFYWSKFIFFPDLPQIDLIMIFPRMTKLGREDIIHVAIQVTSLIVGSKKRDHFAYAIFFVVSVKLSSF